MWLVWLLHTFLIKIVSVACVIKCQSAHEKGLPAWRNSFAPSLRRPPQHIVFINCIKFGHFLTHTKSLGASVCEFPSPSLQTLGLDALRGTAAFQVLLFASEGARG